MNTFNKRVSKQYKKIKIKYKISQILNCKKLINKIKIKKKTMKKIYKLLNQNKKVKIKNRTILNKKITIKGQNKEKR